MKTQGILGPFARHPRAPLLGLLTLLLATHLAWFHLGVWNQHWDGAIHLYEGLDASRTAADPGPSPLTAALDVSWYYPPLVSWVAILFYGLLGKTELAGYMVMVAFSLLLVTAVHAIARRLFDVKTALLAAGVTAALPLVVRFGHEFMLDLPLAGLVALAVAALLATDEFAHRGRSMLLGLTLGAGLLTKWTFPVFLAGPLIVGTMRAWRVPADRKRRLGNLALALLLGTLAASPWYLRHVLEIATHRLGELSHHGGLFSRTAFFYLRWLPESVSWPLLLVLIPGCVIGARRFPRESRFLAAWFSVSYLGLALVGFKVVRFGIPLLPPVVVAGCAGIVALTGAGPWWRRRAAALAATLAVVVYACASYVPADSPLGRSLATIVLGNRIIAASGPVRADWRQGDIVAVIEHDRLRRGIAQAPCRVIPDHRWLNNATVRYRAALVGAPIIVTGTNGYPLFTDYAVLKSADIGLDSSAGHRQALQAEILAEAGDTHGLFAEIARLPLPDGSAAVVLRRKPPSTNGPPSNQLTELVGRQVDQFVRRYLRPDQDFAVTVAPADGSGLLPSIRVRSARADLGDFAFKDTGVAARDLDLEIGDVAIDWRTLGETGELRILSLGWLRVRSLALRDVDLLRYLQADSGGDPTVTEIAFRDGRIEARGRWEAANCDLRLGIGLDVRGGEALHVAFTRVQLGWLRVPAWLVNWVTGSYNPVFPGADFPLRAELGPLRLDDNELRLGTDRIDRVPTAGTADHPSRP